MPVNSNSSVKDTQELHYQYSQFDSIDKKAKRRKRDHQVEAESTGIMEPAPRPINQYDEIKGWAKERLGRLLQNKIMEKEGKAIEKAAHPEREWAKAEERLQRLFEQSAALKKRDPHGRRYTS